MNDLSVGDRVPVSPQMYPINPQTIDNKGIANIDNKKCANQGTNKCAKPISDATRLRRAENRKRRRILKKLNRSISEKITEMDKKNYAVITHDGNMKKRWYIEYYVIERGVKIRHRLYGNINRLKTVETRDAHIQMLLADLQNTSKTIAPAHDGARLADACLGFYEKNKGSWREKTQETYFSKINIFLKWAKKQGIVYNSAVTRTVSESFLEYLKTERKLLPQTQKNYVDLLEMLFDSFMSKEANPWAFKIKKTPAVAALYYQKHQKPIIKTHLQKTDAQLLLFVEFIYYCFIRPGELRRLKVSDIYLAEAKILVRAEISKNKKEQWVVIPDVFLPKLYEVGIHQASPNDYLFTGLGFFGEKPIGKNEMNKRHCAMLKELKFDTARYKLYSWKHTGAVDKVKAGINIKELQMQLRHADLNETARYIRDMGIADMDDVRSKTPEI